MKLNYQYYFLWENNRAKTILEDFLKSVEKYLELKANMSNMTLPQKGTGGLITSYTKEKENNYYRSQKELSDIKKHIAYSKSLIDEIFYALGESTVYDYSPMQGYSPPRKIHIVSNIDECIDFDRGETIRMRLYEVIGKVFHNKGRSILNIINPYIWFYKLINWLLSPLYEILPKENWLEKFFLWIIQIMSFILSGLSIYKLIIEII
jgi:hypothetical protein